MNTAKFPPPPPGVDPKRYNLAIEFMGVCYELFGAYLTSVSGLHFARENLITFQKELVEKLKKTDPEHASIDFLDTQTADHQLEAGAGEAERLMYRTTQGEFKANTAPLGPTERSLGRMSITFLYAAWEDKFRGQFAQLLGYPGRSDLKDDLFGDLGYLRNAAIHNHGIATEDVERKTKIVKWYRKGQEMVITSQHVDTLIDEMDHFCARFTGIERNVPSLRNDVPQ